MNKNLLAALIFGGFAVAGGIQATGNNNDANTASTVQQQQQKAADGTLNSAWNSDEWATAQKNFEEQRKKVADMQAQSAAEFDQLDAEYRAGKAQQEAQHQAGQARKEVIRQQYEAGKAKVDAAMAKQ